MLLFFCNTDVLGEDRVTNKILITVPGATQPADKVGAVECILFLYFLAVFIVTKAQSAWVAREAPPPPVFRD